MTAEQLAAYVDAACAANDLVLAPDERERVIVHFARLAAIAAPVLDLPLAAEIEPAGAVRP